MKGKSPRLSVSPIGRTVAQSILHPRSADQLMRFAAERVDDLLTSGEGEGEANEELLHYSILHAAYSSDEYSIRGSNRNLPYQLDNLVRNTFADAANELLIERPWQRNAAAANASMLAVRWIGGRARGELAPELPVIGSGVVQTMIREGTEILFAWSDCLISATGSQLIDEDRPAALGTDRALHRSLRNLAAVIRAQARMMAVGLPGDVVWMARLISNGAESAGRPLLSRSGILALWGNGLTEPIELLRHDTFARIVEALRPLGPPDLDGLVRSLRDAVRQYRQDRRARLWRISIDRAPEDVKAILQDMADTRGKDFEKSVEALLDTTGIAYERLDDGRTPGAADLLLGVNLAVQIVIELKTAEGEGAIGLNEATDVIKGAAIVNHPDLPKATVANPGFDPNVLWQIRNVRDLALVEASQFAYGISRLARNEINNSTFLDWLAQPGMNSIPISALDP